MLAIQKLTEATQDLQAAPFSPTRDLALSLVNSAQRALAAAVASGDASAAKNVRDKLATIEEWFKLHQAKMIESNLLVAERLRAERTIGEMLALTVRRGNPQFRPEGGNGRIPDGISEKQSRKWQKLAEIEPEDFEAWVAERMNSDELSTAAALTLWRQLHPAHPDSTPELPLGQYYVILADPPWQYSNSGFDESADSQYPTMHTDDICALPVGQLATDSTVLFLWATNPLLKDALAVMAAWGFEYKTNMAWVKDRGRGKGWWLKSRHELLLIGTREETPQPIERPDSCFMADRPSAHSKKPTIVYELIESMFAGSKVELFARAPRDGWQSWGNEA